MLDQDIVNLAKAIREHETGNRQIQGQSGEMASRYQYLPGTWQSTAGKYLGNPNAPLTLENENKATYLKLKDWKDQGYNPAQIASMWNSGQPEWEGKVGTNKYGVNYNVPKYVESVYSKYKKLKAETPVIKQQPTEQPKEEKGFFTRVKEDIARRAENINKKAELKEQGKIGLFSQVLNFASQGFGALGDVAFEALVSATPNAVKDKAKELGKDVLETDLGKQGLEAAKAGVDKWQSFKDKNPETATNIESLANFAEVIPVEKGLGLGLKSGKKITKIGEEIGGDIIEQGGKISAKAGEQIAEKAPIVTKYGISQATGLAPETIEQVVKNPEKFTLEAIKSVDRDALAKDALGKIEERINALKDTGKAYEAIRKSAAPVEINNNFFDEVLKSNFGLDVVDGKIVSTTKSATRNANDIKAIQNLYDNWSPDVTGRTTLDADEFLNLRNDLSELSKFDATRTSASQNIARGLRQELNIRYRNQIEGLEALDNAYSIETQTLKKIKTDYFKKDGSLKDNAISKLANLTGKGKEQALQRLEGLIPDIGEQVNILKAIEDIRYAGGQKVGTYTRSIIAGGGIATGNIPLTVMSIISTPQIAVQLLRKYGAIKKISKELIDGTINSLKSGRALVGKQLQVFRDMLNEKSQEFINFLKELKNNQKGFQKIPDKLTKESRGQTYLSPDEIGAIQREATAREAKLATAVKKAEKQDPLIQEAKKYKSAEEFVKSQSLYHGTPNELEGGALKFGAGKQLKKGGYMGGHFLTDTPEIADNFSFGGKVYQTSGEIKNKVLDVNKSKKLFQDFVGKKYKTSDGELVEFTKQEFDYMFPEGKADWSTLNTDLAEQIAKNNGKIGVAIPEYAGGKQGMTYQIFEDNIPVKTKQELTDIWNKANKN